MAAAAASPLAPPRVTVLETKTAGAYKIAVLSAKDSSALKNWLADNHFYFPADKADVLDSYIQRHWFFVAVRIRLGGRLVGFMSTSRRLAAGELNPVQISFASDRCVFPLKISSVNGKSSEVQLYVLSPGPLVERGMLEKKLSELNRSAADAGEWPEGLRRAFPGPQNELLPFMKVDAADLPDCSRWVPRLGGKSWWLSKQTWTFKPEEMRDLEFDPAQRVIADMLGTRYGRFAAASLPGFGKDADSTIIAAIQSTNPAVRAAAAGIFSDGRWALDSVDYDPVRDQMFENAALKWLGAADPSVRRAGIELLTSAPTLRIQQASAIVRMLSDEDADVRKAAVERLLLFSEVTNHFMPVFIQMLKSDNPAAQASALHMLHGQQITIPREVLLSILESGDTEALDAAWTQLHIQGDRLSDDDAQALLGNRLPAARCLGLDILGDNPGKQSVELALPLMEDPDEFVRLRASQTLQALTGQHFAR